MSGEKTEKATPKRKKDERNKGQVFLSKEAITVATLFSSFLILKLWMPRIQATLQDTLYTYIHLGANVETITRQDLRAFFVDCCFIFSKCAIPILLLGILVNVTFTFAQTKMLFSMKALQFKGERLNPINGFKKLFSIRSIVELIKSILKLSVILAVLWVVLKKQLYTIPMLMDMTPLQAMGFTGGLIFQVAIKVGVLFLFLAAGDYFYQWWEYEKNLRMSKQEIKDEYKQMEGDPQVKNRIRQLQQQRARNRMMQQVPNADVVIRNPTHYAVAIQYNPDKHRSPIVLAKGADAVALRIIAVAEENDVHVTEDRPLARALYDTVELNHEIPSELYQAVAEVIAFVYSLKKKDWT